MAFGRTSLGSSGGGTGGRAMGGGGQRPLSDINVTPLVDVMLVLLVIFIITAPLMASSIKLDLPRTDAGQPGETPHFLSLAIDPGGQVFLNDQPMPNDEALAERLRQAAAQSPETEIQLRADQRVPYGRLVALMGVASQAGLHRIGFVTQPPALPKPSETPAGAAGLTQAPTR